jgi:diguanylate cyclase (GGDEF)-like protein/PAS domain S-box-containing protein/putative nucleotidyltransferase with HDIG domain
MANRDITILAIDDNEDNLISMKALLNESFPHVKVITAISGPEGFEIASTGAIDVVLLDIVMPGMDGFTLCRMLKSDKVTRDIPVVFVTAIKGDKESRIIALESGAEGFLAKPIDESELIAMVRAMIKISAVNIDKRDENERLAVMVEERTQELKKSNQKGLELLSSLRKENESRRESEDRYRTIFEEAPLGICLTDSISGLIYQANDQFVRLIGRPVQDKDGPIDWMCMTHPDDLQQDLENMALMNDQITDGYSMEKRFVRPDGSIVWVNMKITQVNLLSNDHKCHLSMFEDITERKRAEDALEQSERRLIAAQKMAHVGNWELDLTSQTIWASEEAYNIYGIESSSRSISLKEVQAAVVSEYRKFMDDKLARLIQKKEPYDTEYIIKKESTGEEIYVNSKAIVQLDHAGRPVKIIGTVQDIDDRKRAEENLKFLSFHDQLTGVYNRRFLEQEMARLDSPDSIPLSILMGDLNGLKMINDSLGHAVGDELLRKAAEIIKKACREGDTIARTGGDEFVVLLPRTNADEAAHILIKIKKLATLEKIQSASLSISFGYHIRETMEETIQEVAANAENDMYRHKLYDNASMRSKAIDMIMNTLFEKSNRELMHSKRVSETCEAIAMQMNFDADEINKIRTAGLLHDIGKIGVDEHILNKSQKLDDGEWQEIKKHPEASWRILNSANEFSELANFVLEHHERWDGKGYPNGLTANDISLEARIITVADSYDAMTSDRTYRKGLNLEEACKEIKRCAGTQFDPEVAKLFVEKVLNQKW